METKGHPDTGGPKGSQISRGFQRALTSISGGPQTTGCGLGLPVAIPIFLHNPSHADRRLLQPLGLPGMQVTQDVRSLVFAPQVYVGGLRSRRA